MLWLYFHVYKWVRRHVKHIYSLNYIPSFYLICCKYVSFLAGVSSSTHLSLQQIVYKVKERGNPSIHWLKMLNTFHGKAWHHRDDARLTIFILKLFYWKLMEGIQSTHCYDSKLYVSLSNKNRNSFHVQKEYIWNILFQQLAVVIMWVTRNVYQNHQNNKLSF